MANKTATEISSEMTLSRLMVMPKDEYELRLSKVSDLKVLNNLYLETVGKDSRAVLRRAVEARIKQLGGTV